MTFLSPHPNAQDLYKAEQRGMVYFDGLRFSPAAYGYGIKYAAVSTFIFFSLAQYFLSMSDRVSPLTAAVFSPVVSIPVILIYGTLVHYVLFFLSQKRAWPYVLAGGLPFLFLAFRFDRGGYRSGYDPVLSWLYVNPKVLTLVAIGMVSAYGFYRGLDE